MNRILIHLEECDCRRRERQAERREDICRQLNTLVEDVAEFVIGLTESGGIVCFTEAALTIDDPENAAAESATWLRETALTFTATADRLEGGAV